MPKIPTYDAEARLPEGGEGVRAPLNLLNAPAAALGDVAEGVGQIANVLAERRQQIKKQRDYNQFLEVSKAFSDEWTPFETQELARTGRDTFDNVERGKAMRDEMLERYAEAIDDPDMKLRLKQGILNTTDRALGLFARHQAAQSKAMFNDNLDATAKTREERAYYSPGIADALFQESREELAGAVESGMISQDEADARLEKDEASLYTAAMSGLVDTDPRAAIKMLEARTYNSHLPYGAVQTLTNRAIALKNAQDQDAENAEKKLRHEAEIALKDARAKWEVAALTDMKNLTRAQVLASPLNKTAGELAVDSERVEKFFKLIEAYEQDPEGFKTDPVAEAEIQRLVYLNPDNLDADSLKRAILDRVGKGLSPEDGNTYIGKIGKADDPMKAPGAKAILKALEADYKNGVFGEGQDAQVEYARQVQSFISHMEGNPNADPIKYYEQQIGPEKNNWIVRALTGDKFKKPEISDRAYRRQAIEELSAQNKLVNEETINKVVELLKEQDNAP